MENTDGFHVKLESWITEIIKEEQPEEGLRAFRVGIDEYEEGYILYLAGSKNYDEADDEWAAYPPEFIAEKHLAVSNENEQEWYWMLLQVIYSLGRILRKNVVENSFLGGDTPVYAGFADGDLYRIK